MQSPSRWLSVFEAINGKENPDFPLFKKHNAKKRFERKGSVSTAGAIRVFCEPLFIMGKMCCVKCTDIVLEDDAILQQNFLSAYQFLCQVPSQFEFYGLVHFLR